MERGCRIRRVGGCVLWRVRLWMILVVSDYWLDNSVFLEEKMIVDLWVWNLLWGLKWLGVFGFEK